MFRIKKLYYIVFCCVLVVSHVEASEFSFKDGFFTYKGYVIDTAFDVNPENYKTEGGVLTKITNNELNEFKVIEIISQEGALEIWLFNEVSESKFLKLDTYPTDYRVSWLSSQHLEVSRSHMGTSVTYIYKVTLPLTTVKKSKAIDKMIFFDPHKELFIRYAFHDSRRTEDNIIIGDAFGDYEEVFEIKFNYKYLSDAFGLIESARLEGNLIFINIKQDDALVTYQYQTSKW